MSKMLSKEEVNKLLGINPNHRMPTREEVDSFLVELHLFATEKGIDPKDVSEEEIKEILSRLNIENVEIVKEDHWEKYNESIRRKNK